MMISARAAERHLSQVGLSRRHAQRVLASGLAGEPVRTAGAVLYDEERVLELLGRPAVAQAVLEEHAPTGLFVARRLVDVRRPEEEQLAALAHDWGFGYSRGVWIHVQVVLRGFMPLVATVGGFVVAGADVRAVGHQVDTGRGGLSLRPAGEWFADFTGRRLVTGPGTDAVIVGEQMSTHADRVLVPRATLRALRREG